jgi:hypothetical protein
MIIEQMRADGWIEHDGGPIPSCAATAQTGQLSAIYRRAPNKPARLFIPQLEQWIWNSDDLDIIAYRPEPKP